MLCIRVMYQMWQGVTGRHSTVILNMAAQMTINLYDWVCCILRWSKVLGSAQFPWKGKNSISCNKRAFVIDSFQKKVRRICRIKGRGWETLPLGSCIELRFFRLEKGKDDSKAFPTNTQEQWDSIIKVTDQTRLPLVAKSIKKSL